MPGTTEVAEGIFQVAAVPGINTWVVRDDSGVTLIDAGMALTAGRLIDRLSELGVRPGDVDRILLTHAHSDHAGGVVRLWDVFGRADVLAGTEDVPFLQAGTQPDSDTSTLGGRLFNRTPPPFALPDPPAIPDAAPVAGAALDGVGGGCQPVATPGHTPGHTAYRFPAHDLVIAGDVVFNWFMLRPSPRFVCSDVAANTASILRIASLSPATVLLAHGRPITDDPEGRLRQLAADQR